MTDNNICKHEFKEAMRPIAGDNVNRPEVDANFGALGTAVYNILTDKADTISDESKDKAFWQWVQDVNEYLSKLSQWQQEITKAINDWEPTQPPEQDLKKKLTKLSSLGKPPQKTPKILKGKIQLLEQTTTDNQQREDDCE